MPCESWPTGGGGGVLGKKQLFEMLGFLDELHYESSVITKWKKDNPENYSRKDFLKNELCKYKKQVLDAVAAELCQQLQIHDVKQYSLEMQIWLRDHQIEDKKRIEKEIAQKKTAREKRTALNKLTPHERKLLGID